MPSAPARVRRAASSAGARSSRSALTPPAPVWLDAAGAGRNVHAYFRRDLTLTQLPKRLVLHLFADSRYLLHVNGQPIGHGPARFHHHSPEYDSYDLAPYLTLGRNVIAVHVVAFGAPTYFQRQGLGAFTAWGGGDGIELAVPGEWRCIRAAGYADDTLPFSFTSPPTDWCDRRLDPPGWDQPGTDLRRWQTPVPLADPTRWGTLRPRSIPLLTQDRLRAEQLLGAFAHRSDERIVSFKVPAGAPAPGGDGNRWVFAWTRLYSPRAQEVPVGLWWGEHFLNGEEVLRRDSATRFNRQDAVLRLQEGWNTFFVKYGMFEMAWDFHMALPVAAGLRLHAHEHPSGPETVRTAGPFTAAEEPTVRALTLPFAPGDLPALSAGWVEREVSPHATTPAVGLAWSQFGERRGEPASPMGPLTADRPTSFCWDMGREMLGRLSLRYDAPAGTIIDIGFAEHWERGRPAVLWRSMIYAGERVIARGGPDHFESTAPRGLRYVQVDVTPPPGGSVRLEPIEVVEQIYPFTQTGSFACSDQALTAIWAMGWRTLRQCSEDSYVDCPWRERHLYAGDFLPEAATTIAVSGDLRLTRRCLELLAPADQPLVGNDFGDFALHPIVILGWYLDRTGDTAGTAALYPRYRRTLEHFAAARKTSGLVRSKRAFIDWINTEPDAQLTAVNSLAAAACTAGARIAARLRLKDDAARWTREAAAFARAVATRCWDDQAGAFRDGWRDEQPLPRASLAASAWASLFAGAATPARLKRLRAHYEQLLARVHGEHFSGAETSPYGGFYILGALYQAGFVDLAERFMREAWSSFLASGIDTAWEVFPRREVQPDGSVRYVPQGGSSLCHAWSSGPTYYLATQALGVGCGFPEPQPDPRVVTIAPQSATLTWARGTVVHPRGPVEVSWRREGRVLLLDYRVPKGVRATVAPRGPFAGLDLVVNGVRQRR